MDKLNSAQINNLIRDRDIKSIQRITVPIDIKENDYCFNFFLENQVDQPIWLRFSDSESDENILYWYSKIEHPKFPENIEKMFSGCKYLKNVNGLVDFNTDNVKYMDSLFEGCTSLNDLTGLSLWNTSNVKSMIHTFSSCHSISDLTPIKDWDVRNVEYVRGIFHDCRNLQDLFPIKKWRYNSAKDIFKVFDQ